MVWLALALIPVAFMIALPLCAIVRRSSIAAGAVDSEPVPGQQKMAARRIPNTGGVGIFLAIVIPLGAALAAAHVLDGESLPSWLETAAPHFDGARSMTALGLGLIACLGLLHTLGLIDDRRPMGPWIKLAVMAVPALIVAWPMDTRLLTLLDDFAGGPWLSIIVTVAWIVLITNAMNFIDNMDGLASGVAAVAGAGFLAAALLQEQWFVGAVLALLVGASLGFLVLNFPPARLFMGDGGSLVLGFLLAFLTVRTTYAVSGDTPGSFAGGAWYALLMPVVVLAVPLYDFTSVTAIRLSQGKSPFVGDLQHLSHRLVKRGLSVRAAVIVIYGVTGASAIAGVLLASATPVQAVLIGILVLLLLLVLAMLEYGSSSRAGEYPRG